MHTQQFRRPAVIGIQLRSQSSCSFQCHQKSPVSSTSRQNRGAQASTICQTPGRAAGICAQPSVSCLPSSLIRLRTFGQGRIQGCRHYRQRQPIVATAIRPQTAEPLRKQQRRHSSQERPLLTRHWCWEWGSSRWRASLFFLLGKTCPERKKDTCVGFDWKCASCKEHGLCECCLLAVGQAAQPF